MSTIDLLKELVSIPSTLGKTAEIEEFVADFLRQTAEPEFIDVPGKGRTVMASAVSDPGKPTFLLNGHLDTVEVCNGWTREPFGPVIEGDRLYGLGAADMKAGIAIGLTVFVEAAKAGHNILYTGTIDEEGDSAGAFALFDSGKLPDADLCLIQEPTYGKAMLGCRGRFIVDVDVHGRSAHGATPEKGVSAVVEASRLASALEEGLPIREHPLLGKGSHCILDMRGGTTTLSVPEACRIVIDRHVVPGDTKESVVSEIKQLAAGLNSPAEFDVRLNEARPTPFLKPWVTEPEGLAGQFLRTANTDKLYGKSVGDYNLFAQHYPTVVYGPHGENWHMADEWVSISSLNDVLDTYRRFFKL